MSLYAGILCSYLAGTLILNWAGLGTALLFSVCLLVCTITGIAVGRLRKSRGAYAAAVLLGSIIMSFALYPSGNDLIEYLDRYIEAEGVICEQTDEFEEYSAYVLSLEKVTYKDEIRKVSGKIRITSEQRLDTGNRVAFRGFLNEISAPDNSTEFNYRLYYKGKGIIFNMHAEEAQIIDERVFMLSIPYAVEYVKSRIGFAIDKFYREDDAALIKAVLLGNKAEFSPSFKKLLVRTSAIRFLYPSYLHIFLLISVCGFVFASVPARKREYILVVMLILFALLNSGFTTFVRAAIMSAAVTVYRRKRGFSDYFDMLSIAVLICMVSNPLLLYNSGFVMSVAAGILIQLFRRKIAALMVFTKNKQLRSSLAVWIICTLGLLPFSAYYFNGMPLYSIIFTILYMPLTLALLISAPLCLLLYEIFGAAGPMGVFVNGLLALMQNIPKMVALLPGYYITLGKTTMLGFAVFVSLCIVIKLWLDHQTKERKFKIAAAALSVLCVIYTVIRFADFGAMFITFVNVGQGDGAVINIKGKDTILVDGGGGSGESQYNVGENVFVPYLSAKGISYVDLAIVSHCHRDHCEGIIAAIENLRVHTVMLSDTNEGEEYRRQIIKAAEENGTQVLYVSEGDSIEFNSGLVIDVLSPASGTSYEDDNDSSLVLKMEYNGSTLFFGGDITNETERRIAGKVGEVDIVKVSHHGSKNSSSQQFIEEASPEFAVFSVGKGNMYGHPSEQAVAGYRNIGAKILRTDTMCDIVIKCNTEGKISAVWHGEEQQWR